MGRLMTRVYNRPMLPLPPRPPSRTFWPLAVALGLFLLVGSIVELVLRQEQQSRATDRTQHMVESAARLRAAIESELNSTLHLATGLAAYIKAEEGNLRSRELEAFQAGLFRQGRYIRNIGIAPGNRLAHVYPLAGNEKALGLYYPDLPNQWPAVERTIRERRPTLAGPLNLVQGGLGLIYRVPVFLDDSTYWGLVSMVVNAEQFIRSVSAVAVENNLRIGLRGTDGLGGRGAVFWGSDSLFADNPVLMDIAIPGGSWQLAVRQADPSRTDDWLAYMRAGAWLVAAVIGLLAFLVTRSYGETLRLATSLQRSEDRYRETFEAINDGIWEWNINTGMITWDARCYRMLGYEPSSASMSEEAWIRRINPADAPATLATVKEKIGRSERFEAEFRLRNRDNNWLWVAMRGRVVAWRGDRPIRVAGTLADISVRKEAELALRTSEQRVRTLLGAMTDLVFAIDAAGRFSEFHPPSHDGSRYPAPEQVIGRHYEDVLPPDAALAMRETITGLYVDHRPRLLEFKLAVGERPRLFQGTMSCLSDGSEWPPGFLCVAREMGASEAAAQQAQ